MKHKVGIIVPVYNTEKYLSDCINSVLNQTYNNFRLILVNDGSKDNSGSICDSFRELDERIIVIHKENGGANSARAMGVQYAIDCEYITFVDSDDTLYDYTLENLVSCINEHIDIVIGKVNDKAIVSDCKETIEAEDYRKRLICQKISWSPCAKLYKKALFNVEIFSIPASIKLGEDYLMNLKLSFNLTNKVYLLPECVYKYNRTMDSITSTTINSIILRENLYKEVLCIIPSNKSNEYINELITLRLRLLHKYVIKLDYSIYKDMQIYTTLIKDIDNSSYPIDYLYKQIFKSKNNFVKKVFILLFKLKNKINNILSK